MDIMNLINLGGLLLLSDAETRSISAENPTGEKGVGAGAEVPTMEQMAAIPGLCSPGPDLPAKKRARALPCAKPGLESLFSQGT